MSTRLPARKPPPERILFPVPGISVLEASYIAFRLRPFVANPNKRLVKTPKLFFYDTGLLCCLLGIRHPEQIRTHPLRGAIFETWVASEILKARPPRPAAGAAVLPGPQRHGGRPSRGTRGRPRRPGGEVEPHGGRRLLRRTREIRRARGVPEAHATLTAGLARSHLHLMVLAAPVWSASSTWSTVKLPDLWLGGYSLKLSTNMPTAACAGTKIQILSRAQRSHILDSK